MLKKRNRAEGRIEQKPTQTISYSDFTLALQEIHTSLLDEKDGIEYLTEQIQKNEDIGLRAHFFITPEGEYRVIFAKKRKMGFISKSDNNPENLSTYLAKEPGLKPISKAEFTIAHTQNLLEIERQVQQIEHTLKSVEVYLEQGVKITFIRDHEGNLSYTTGIRQPIGFVIPEKKQTERKRRVRRKR